MFIDDFVWLPQAVEKLDRKHDLSQDEVEGIFFNRPYFRFVERGWRKGEDVYSALGRAESGRYVIVFFIHKSDGSALVMSARDMDRKERKIYGKR